VAQVKPRADLTDLSSTIAQFSADDYWRVFFVVHSPAKDLENASDIPGYVAIVSLQRVAELAIDAGAVGWIEGKVS
jgi:hypothetical protein